MKFWKKLFGTGVSQDSEFQDLRYVESKKSPGLIEGRCSDTECPCPAPGTVIPRGTGHMYISQETVEFRTLYPLINDARAAMQERLLEKNRDIVASSRKKVVFRYDIPAGILVCKEGAMLRNLDLNVAARDAKHWWEKNEIPLRATPIIK